MAEAYNASTLLSSDAGSAASWPLDGGVARPLAFFLLLTLLALTVLLKSVAGLEACTRARPKCEPAMSTCGLTKLWQGLHGLKVYNVFSFFLFLWKKAYMSVVANQISTSKDR